MGPGPIPAVHEGLTVRLELASIAATSDLAENGDGDLRMSLKV